MLSTIHAKSSTRIDLSGGTLDCWPLYNFVSSPCVTVNFSLGIFTRVQLQPSDTQEIRVAIKDLNYYCVFSDQTEFMSKKDPELKMIQGVVKYFSPRTGFSLLTQSESPVGAGLGGSSSLIISLLKAFGEWLKVSWSTLEMVEVAHNLEAKIIHAPTGTQDYFPAVETGLHFIHYSANSPHVETEILPAAVLSEHLTLVYTGIPHHSGINNWQVIKSAVQQEEKTLHALDQIAQVSWRMMKAIKNQNWQEIPQLFTEEFSWRVALSPYFTSSRIEELKDLALQAGAEAIKICGAGGGGCVVIWSSPEKKIKVEKECTLHGYQILPLHLNELSPQT